MEKSEYSVLGVMSGTSLDGIDLAYVKFWKEKEWNFQLTSAGTINYEENWKQKLSEAINLSDNQLRKLDKEYTKLLSSVINDFVDEHQVSHLDAICSHGHTIKHQPQRGLTIQIGNLPELTDLTGSTVVCDFRVQDVELGGQGAPLVPIGDKLLFSQYKYCLNLGGFANISTESTRGRIAYDVCPVNTVLNFFSEKLGHSYDDGGKIASSGKLLPDLLRELDQKAYYQTSGPKSLGMEWVNAEIIPLLIKFRKDVPSVLNTFCIHIAEHVVKNLDNNFTSEVLVTGGGAYNNFLMEEIRKRTKTKIYIPSAEIVNFKEAIVFGLLGVLKLRNEINVLSSVTGASRDHSSGKVFLPEN